MNEEEKKIIKKFVEKCNNIDESVEIKGVSVGEEYRILETVCKTLDLVEKLQKENEYYKECLEVVSKHLDNIDYDQILFAIYEYYISKQKVKDKIEELKAQYKTALEENSTEAFILKCQITILQELIEEREEK